MIYRRGNAFLETTDLRISVGAPPEPGGGRFPPPEVPGVSAVQAVVTRRCNLRCNYCNVRLSGDTGSTMTAEIADRVVSAAQEALPGRLLMITGGEPLLEPDLMFRILENTSPPYVVFTNGTLVSERTADRFLALGVNPVVSLDGMQQNHDPQRSDSWQRVAAGLDLFRSKGVQYGISTVLSVHNAETLSGDIRRIRNRFRPTGLGVNILHWTCEDFRPPSGEKYASVMEDVFRFALEEGVFIDQIARRLDPLIHRRYRYRDCAAMGGKIVFHPDGRLSNCISSRTMSDWSRRIPWYMDHCRDCHAAGICGGGCAWDAEHLGRNGGPDPRHCLWVKRILDAFLDDVQSRFPDGPVEETSLISAYGNMVTRGEGTLSSSLGHGG